MLKYYEEQRSFKKIEVPPTMEPEPIATTQEEQTHIQTVESAIDVLNEMNLALHDHTLIPKTMYPLILWCR
jgi:hypothetical protein